MYRFSILIAAVFVTTGARAGPEFHSEDLRLFDKALQKIAAGADPVEFRRHRRRRGLAAADEYRGSFRPRNRRAALGLVIELPRAGHFRGLDEAAAGIHRADAAALRAPGAARVGGRPRARRRSHAGQLLVAHVTGVS